MVVLLVGVKEADLTPEMLGGESVEEVAAADLPKRLIQDMDACIIFSPEFQPHVELCCMAQGFADGPTLVMFRDGGLFICSGGE